jgi:hypothetical protein
MQGRHIEPVLQDDREPVAAFDAQSGEASGRPADLSVPFAIAEAAYAIADRQRLGTALGAGEKGAA